MMGHERVWERGERVREREEKQDEQEEREEEAGEAEGERMQQKRTREGKATRTIPNQLVSEREKEEKEK